VERRDSARLVARTWQNRTRRTAQSSACVEVQCGVSAAAWKRRRAQTMSGGGASYPLPPLPATAYSLCLPACHLPNWASWLAAGAAGVAHTRLARRLVAGWLNLAWRLLHRNAILGKRGWLARLCNGCRASAYRRCEAHAATLSCGRRCAAVNERRVAVLSCARGGAAALSEHACVKWHRLVTEGRRGAGVSLAGGEATANGSVAATEQAWPVAMRQKKCVPSGVSVARLARRGYGVPYSAWRIGACRCW